MKVEAVRKVHSTLPFDDDNPYRTGAWRPQTTEYDAYDLDVVGEIPADLEGVYLRNTENPVHPAIGLYHPFDGDGMLHMLKIGGGTAQYRNRFIQTDGFVAEQEQASALWAGLLAAPEQALRPGWGARGGMKDASSTDVVVHRGRAITSFYQCGDLYAMDPLTLEPRGKEAWVPPHGISAHTKVDELTGEMMVFSYFKGEPHLQYGVVSPTGELTTWQDVPTPGPRLPHDMAFTPSWSILNDLPLFWDPELLTKGVHLPRFFPDTPSRFGLVPRHGGDVRWFEAAPTYVLHWINAFEDGDEVVLDGFFQRNPEPARREGESRAASLYRTIDLERLQAVPHRWRFNLRTGQTTEHDLSDTVMEFGMINGRVGGLPYRYAYNATGAPGMFAFNGLVKHDVLTGAEQRLRLPDGVYASESPFAPRIGSSSEDDGYVLTFTTDTVNDLSECLVLDARDITAEPLARIRLPERISSGTHATWASGADLRAAGAWS